MPPITLDLDLEPWKSVEQAPTSAPREFQEEEAGPCMQRTVRPIPAFVRQQAHSLSRAQADANGVQPSKRKHPHVDPSPPGQSSTKKHKSLSETELGIIKLAAGILEIPVASLLSAHFETYTQSAGSSITYDSHDAPSTGPEQTDGFDIPAEPARHAPPRRQQPDPTPTPSFQGQAAYNNMEFQTPTPHSFRGDLSINSTKHLEWWGLNPGVIFEDLEIQTTVQQQTSTPTRQDPISQLNNWGQTRFEEAVITSDPDVSGQPAWASATETLHNEYHTQIQTQNISANHMQQSGPIAPHTLQPDRQMFGPFPYGAMPHQETRISDLNPTVMETDQNGVISESAFGSQDMRLPSQARGVEDVNQSFASARPRQRRNHSPHHSRRPGRRGPLTEEQRLETSLTRRQGACIRCQWQAIKVKD
jgi:hypothetical protein